MFNKHGKFITKLKEENMKTFGGERPAITVGNIRQGVSLPSNKISKATTTSITTWSKKLIEHIKGKLMPKTHISGGGSK